MADRKPIEPVKKGALHADLGIPQGEKIGKDKLEAAKSSGSPQVRKRANFALNMAYKDGGLVTTDHVLPGVSHYSKRVKE